MHVSSMRTTVHTTVGFAVDTERFMTIVNARTRFDEKVAEVEHDQACRFECMFTLQATMIDVIATLCLKVHRKSDR